MRLIDADELKKEFPHDEDWEFPVNTNGYVVETINRMLTVDAIPIDFIDEWIRELQGICDDDIEKNLSNKFIAVALQALKFKWRKENESSN